MYLVYTPDGIVLAVWILYYLSEVLLFSNWRVRSIFGMQDVGPAHWHRTLVHIWTNGVGGNLRRRRFSIDIYMNDPVYVWN